MINRIKNTTCFIWLLFLAWIIIMPSDLFGQTVNAYPKDGKIRDLKGKVQEDIVVAKDGTGDFLYIQDAIDAIRVYLPKPITVYIKEGIYKEKLLIPGTVTNVTFQGDGPGKTVITFDDHTGKNNMQTFDTYSLMVLGSALTFKDLTVENTAGRVGQAVALHAEGDRLVFENCHFLGNQDTMFASGEGSRQYYKNCYIEGTTDYIFGSATAYFENCEIHSKSNSFITAASTPEWVSYGYVFDRCRLTAAEGVEKVYLGRPWRDHAKTVFINCEMADHIVPEGWSDWNRPETHQTTFYAEYNNTGPGANIKQRVAWAHQLEQKDLPKYRIHNIFGKTSKKQLGQQWYAYERDTSYTIYSAYQKAKKQFPEISLVEENESIKRIKDIPYKTLGYRSLSLDIFYSEENKKGKYVKPAVLLVHGGGWRSGSKSLQWSLAQSLAAKGYLAAVVEYRLSLEEPFPGAVEDIQDAIKWLKKNALLYNLDTGKMAVSGSSAGGQLATLAAFTANEQFIPVDSFSSKVQAVINMDGVLAFHHPESEEGEMAAFWLGGDYEEVPEIWKAASPLYQLDENPVPILFINSQYPRFHAGRDEMIAILEKKGVYSEVHTFPESPHTFWLFHPWHKPTVKLIDEFLKGIF